MWATTAGDSARQSELASGIQLRGAKGAKGARFYALATGTLAGQKATTQGVIPSGSTPTGTLSCCFHFPAITTGFIPLLSITKTPDMTRTRKYAAAALAVVLAAAAGRSAPDVAPAPRPVLVGYTTVDRAIKADPKKFSLSGAANIAPAGWLGVVVGEKKGKPVIEAIAPESPAEVAGLQEGDQITTIDGDPAGPAAAVRDVLRGSSRGTRWPHSSCAGKTIQAKATLLATSRPMSANTTRVVMGVTLGNPGKGGITIDEVTASGPAEQGGSRPATWSSRSTADPRKPTPPFATRSPTSCRAIA